MTRHTIYVLLILGLWFFADSFGYWMSRTEVHTVPARTVRL